MKSVIFIHASLFLLGSVMGFFMQYESSAGRGFWDSVAAFPLGVATVVLVGGGASLASRHHLLASTFWLYYLCAVLFFGIALGMTGQYLFKGADWQTPLWVFSSCLGCLVGHAGVARIHRVRHGRDIWDTPKPE
ncbi:hypothetical protein [Halopseudomonas sabulinigri]|uniref:hypothetical protein n=1 Tax=Halopseudomonas sabulinigri TaxID=472181 RepID=UPI000B837A6C|nr:hypothetical protein [Halopseudomonas sabulinigri]